MEEKILERLISTYSNLGLPKSIFEFRAKALAQNLTEESQIEEAVKGENDFLKSIQSFGDQRAIGKKGKDGDNKGDEKDTLGGNGNEGTDSELRKLIEQQNALIEGLVKRVNDIDTNSKQKSFDETVNRVAEKLNLRGEMLELAKAKLSPDMDEKAIRNSLGETKKIYISLGANFENENGGKYISEEEVARKEAAEWVKSNEIKE